MIMEVHESMNFFMKIQTAYCGIDKTVQNWIYASVCSSFLKHLIVKSSAYEYWAPLAKVFNKDSQAKLMELRYRLQTLKKGSQTIEQYISVAKDLKDYILAAGDKINDREQILYVLEGVDFNYTSLITTITNMKRILPPNKVFPRMRMHERQHERMHFSDPDLIHANYANYSKNNRFIGFSNKPHHVDSKNTRTSSHVFDQTETQNSSQDKGKNSKYENIQCQICKKMEHTIAGCYFILLKPKTVVQQIINCRLEVLHLSHTCHKFKKHNNLIYLLQIFLMLISQFIHRILHLKLSLLLLWHHLFCIDNDSWIQKQHITLHKIMQCRNIQQIIVEMHP